MTAPDDPPLHPLGTDSADRLVALDFIRGIAVLGILGANVIGFGQPFIAYHWPGGFATGPAAADRWLWAAQFILIDGKMRGLFTLLFGAGLALFADRTAIRDMAIWLPLRRLVWLLAFGLAHFYLLWRGDILAIYAMCGLLALLAVNWPWTQQAAVGGAAWLFGALGGAATLGGMMGMAQSSLTASRIADGRHEIAIASGGSYLDYVAHTATGHTLEWLDVFFNSAPETLPLMLVGMALYRIGLFDGRLDAKKQARWGWAGIVLGVLLATAIAVWALAEGLGYAATSFAVEGAGAVARIPHVLGLAALLAVWGASATGWLARRIGAAGRMAFSNYLGTSLVMLLVFQPPGLGLLGQLNRGELYGVMLATWVAMLAWSKPWLEKYRYGPLEWLWRCLTYGQVFPLRR